MMLCAIKHAAYEQSRIHTVGLACLMRDGLSVCTEEKI
jgi:hypothetical protein